jgi:hypothetical protein
MGAEVWGTLAVNDHMHREALLRNLLLFDRLVIPKPDTPAERDRWYHPDENNPEQTWDPDGLDDVLRILRTQRQDPLDSLAWEVDWSYERWTAEKSRRDGRSPPWVPRPLSGSHSPHQMPPSGPSPGCAASPAGKRNRTPEPRPLNGASLFASAADHPKIFTPVAGPAA